MVNLLHKILCGDLMKRIIKLITPLLIIGILFSSCSIEKKENPIDQIKTYVANNELNACLQLVRELANDEKTAINKDVCDIVINNFIELREKTKIDETNIFDLSLINTSFAEKCQKLWNIISEFTINDDYELYKECINLRYYSEMIDFTRYCDIYSLVKKANTTDYLDELSAALYEYESNGDNSKLLSLSKKIESINYDSFDPQQYLVSDFKTAHEKIVKSLINLKDGFNSNDSIAVAKAINTLKNALTDTLYIADILSAVNTMQNNIYHKISTENIYAPFDSEIQVSKREYTTGISFSLDMIFGGIEDIVESTTENVISNNSTESTSKDETSLDDAIEIAINAINKTKNFKGNLDVKFIKTQNVKLTHFESNSSISDANNLIESQINQSLKNSNGTTENTHKFYNGTNGNETLSAFIPPNDNNANLNVDAVNTFKCIEGSGGYVITLVLNSELIEYGNKTNNIGSIVNTFSFNNSEHITDFDTAYSKTNIIIVINNDGKLIKMEYIISGISNCVFAEQDTQNIYKTKFTFKNEYKYEFKY